MPEITDAEFRTFVRYQNLGAPEDVEAKIRNLEKDNVNQRRTIKTLEVKVPKEDSAIVPKEDADLLPKYKALGSVSDLEREIKEGREAKTELTTTVRRTSASSFAKAAGLADETVGVLLAIPALQDAKFEVRKGKVKDKNGVEVDGDIPFIVKKDGAVSFEEAKKTIQELNGLRERTPDTPDALNFHKQGGPGGGGAQNVFARIRAQREEEQKAAKEAPAVKSLEERLGIAQA
jgi:hypothetical protein